MAEHCRHRLPAGLTPRLLTREQAALYCGGVSVNHFLEHVAKVVRPIKMGRRDLWDIVALDRYLDERSSITTTGTAASGIDGWLDRLK
jgi:hypothetical protein